MIDNQIFVFVKGNTYGEGAVLNQFNRLTVVAAAEVIGKFHSHDDMKVIELQWDIEQYVGIQASKSGRVAAWAKVATQNNPSVWTEEGQMPLSRAIVALAMQTPDNIRSESTWRKYVAGLRFDGFEIVYEQVIDPSGKTSLFTGEPMRISKPVLKRMLPADIPELDFKEAESEIEGLLSKHGLLTSLGHLAQAQSSFQRGEWAAANGQLRTFFESYLTDIATKLGYLGQDNMRERRKFLGELNPPFLLESYKEWHPNDQKPQFLQGLWSRMHPEGSHPGLSEEEDATFRLQITLVTARLFLRRYDRRTDECP